MRVPCGYCNDTGWVCENHFWIEAHTCKCGGAGKPCRCNKANKLNGKWILTPVVPWKLAEIGGCKESRIQGSIQRQYSSVV